MTNSAVQKMLRDNAILDKCACDATEYLDEIGEYAAYSSITWRAYYGQTPQRAALNRSEAERVYLAHRQKAMLDEPEVGSES